MISEETKEQIKIDIKRWFKENFPECIVPRKALKDIVRTIKHENIHYKISLKFIENVEASMEIFFIIIKDTQFEHGAKCSICYPWFYSLPQYYPKYIFIEFIHYLYDIIFHIFSLRGLEYAISYTTDFIKKLFKFKFKPG